MALLFVAGCAETTEERAASGGLGGAAAGAVVGGPVGAVVGVIFLIGLLVVTGVLALLF